MPASLPHAPQLPRALVFPRALATHSVFTPSVARAGRRRHIYHCRTAGNRLVFEYIETFVCPTTTSDQIIAAGLKPFEFAAEAAARSALRDAQALSMEELSAPMDATGATAKAY